MGDIRRRKNIYKGIALVKKAGPCGTTDQWRIHLHSALIGNPTLNFAPFRRKGREDLAKHFREAVRLERNGRPANTLTSIFRGLKVFFRFLDESKAYKSVKRLREVDRALLLDYVEWLKKRYRAPGTQETIYGRLKSVLVRRAFTVPEDVHPDLREGKFPENLFPNNQRGTVSRRPYSKGEESRIGAAIGKDLSSIAAGEWCGIDSDIVAVVLMALAHRTALNPSALLELRQDCLSPHPESGKREVLTTYKRRGYSVNVQEYDAPGVEEDGEGKEESILESVGALVRLLQKRREKMAAEAAPEDRDSLVLFRPHCDKKGRPRRMLLLNVWRRLEKFAERHDLKDDRGERIDLQLARFRPTGAESFHSLSGGDVDLTAAMMGHSSSDVTSRHYLGITVVGRQRFQLMQSSMVEWALADGGGEAEEERLLSGDWNTAVARCSDPVGGDKAPGDGTVCQGTLKCFQCRNMAVSEEDLYRLMSFRETLLYARDFLTPKDWARKYEWIVRMIDDQIVTKFEKSIVDEARERAKREPHPCWERYKEEDSDVA